MATASRTKTSNNNQTTAELAPKLWATANALRGNIDAAEYKHVVLPLMFLKYISDAFEELHEELESKADEGYDPEEPDEYRERNVFWVPRSPLGKHTIPGPPRGRRGNHRPGHGRHRAGQRLPEGSLAQKLRPR